MIKNETNYLMALSYNDQFRMCDYINTMKGEIDIINITCDGGIYTIFFIEENKSKNKTKNKK